MFALAGQKIGLLTRKISVPFQIDDVDKPLQRAV
jgi:hypothetical protein